MSTISAASASVAVPQYQEADARRSAAPGAGGVLPEGREATLRRSLGAQILQASMEVSIRSGDESQALLFRSALEGIKQALAPTLGPDAIQNAMGQDNSAEATAGRILSMSTAFFDAYAAQRPGDDPETVVRDFVDLVRGGFETGFAEARDILDGLGVFNGQVEADVMKTRELVLQGYDRFLLDRLPTSDQQQ